MLGNVYRLQYRSPKSRLDLESQIAISLLVTIKISLNIHIDKFAYLSVLETTILGYFPSKNFYYTAINLFLRILSTLTIAKFTNFKRTDITLQASVKCLRAITMCSAFTPDCGYYNSTFNLIGDVYCPNSKCLGKLCLHKETFQISRQKRLSMSAMHVCARCAIFHLNINQISFFIVWSKGLHF